MVVHPFDYFAEVKIAARQRAHDEFESRGGLYGQIEAIEHKKSVRGGKSDTFVAVSERMINRKRFHERAGFFDHAAVVSDLRAKYRRFQQGAVSRMPRIPPYSSICFLWIASTSAMVR